MKHLLCVILILSLVLGVTACAPSQPEQSSVQDKWTEDEEEEEEQDEEKVEKEEESSKPQESANEQAQADPQSGKVMTYDEFMAAPENAEVLVEGYVQAKEVWEDNAATVYLQDEVGAYYLYDLLCTQEEYQGLEIGTKIAVIGIKSSYGNMVEILPESFRVVDGFYIAPPTDLSSQWNDEDSLKDHRGEYVLFQGLTVEACNEDGDAFMYAWDGSGVEDQDNVYFNLSKDGKTYSFQVRLQMFGPNTEVYETAQSLKVGQRIDVECFLYWYYGPFPYVAKITIHP